MTASLIPTPGPWIVRGEADDNASRELVIIGVEPATDGQGGGFPYFIRQDRELPVGGCHLHLATGIQRLADAAAPDLLVALVQLLACPDLCLDELDPATCTAVGDAQAALARAQG